MKMVQNLFFAAALFTLPIYKANAECNNLCKEMDRRVFCFTNTWDSMDGLQTTKGEFGEGIRKICTYFERSGDHLNYIKLVHENFETGYTVYTGKAEFPSEDKLRMYDIGYCTHNSRIIDRIRGEVIETVIEQIKGCGGDVKEDRTFSVEVTKDHSDILIITSSDGKLNLKQAISQVHPNYEGKTITQVLGAYQAISHCDNFYTGMEAYLSLYTTNDGLLRYTSMYQSIEQISQGKYSVSEGYLSFDDLNAPTTMTFKPDFIGENCHINRGYIVNSNPIYPPAINWLGYCDKKDFSPLFPYLLNTVNMENTSMFRYWKPQTSNVFVKYQLALYLQETNSYLCFLKNGFADDFPSKTQVGAHFIWTLVPDDVR